MMRRTPLRRTGGPKRQTEMPHSTARLGMSDKRKRENRQRAKVVAQIRAERGDRCEVPGCPRLADDSHEVLSRARGGSITDPANIRRVCRPHHNEITDTEPPWAYQLGFLRHSWDMGETA